MRWIVSGVSFQTSCHSYSDRNFGSRWYRDMGRWLSSYQSKFINWEHFYFSFWVNVSIFLSVFLASQKQIEILMFFPRVTLAVLWLVPFYSTLYFVWFGTERINSQIRAFFPKHLLSLTLMNVRFLLFPPAMHVSCWIWSGISTILCVEPAGFQDADLLWTERKANR